MRRPSSRVPSLRVWLQSTSLLAVVAGYSVLLLINQRMADWQRVRDFRHSSDQVLSTLGTQAGSAKELEQLLREEPLPGLNVAVALGGSGEADDPIATLTERDRQWLVGTVPLDLADGSRVFLRIRQDVSGSVQQERQSFWLLVLAASTSSLFTSGLLRLVLKRGLVQPLEDLSDQLQAIKVPPGPEKAISVEEHPEELRPIAESFNNMQLRLWNSWEQQRIFTDGVAHELRTPITLISGHAQRLLRAATPQELRPSLQLIRSEAERMTSLVSDLLDLARQDAQRLILQRQSIQADEALLQLYERLSFKATNRLHLASGSEEAPEPPLGLGDSGRIQQCLTALVDNALRYSPKDSPIILASSTGVDGTLILHVRDRGPGVPKEERERIFERFVRGSAASGGNTRGSGIGLAVVKLLMEAMGGRVDVCDAPGGGADFQLHLQPFRASGHPPSA